MASIDTGSQKGGKKPLDVSISVIPIIDLMAVIISFLLLTAVSTQVGRLQVAQAGGAGEPSDEEPLKTIPVTLMLSESEARLGVGLDAPKVFPLNRDPTSRQLELKGLVGALEEVRRDMPNQDIITIHTEDAVRYEDLVRVIDVSRGVGLRSVSVQTSAG